MFKPCSCATSSLITSWTIRCCFTRFVPSNADETTVTFMNEPHPPATQISNQLIVSVARPNRSRVAMPVVHGSYMTCAANC